MEITTLTINMASVEIFTVEAMYFGIRSLNFIVMYLPA